LGLGEGQSGPVARGGKRYEVPFEEEQDQDDQLSRSPVRLEGEAPSLPVRRVSHGDRIVPSLVLLLLVGIVGIGFLLGRTPH
jgi:hypothetical protein